MARTEHIGAGEEDGPAIGPAEILAVLRRRAWLIAAMTLVAGAIGMAFAMMMPPRFEAVAVVQIDPRKRTIVNLEPVTSELRADSATIDSEIEVIRSTAVLSRAIIALDLRNDPEFTASAGFLMRIFGAGTGMDSRAAFPEAPSTGKAAAKDPVMAALLLSLKITRIRSSQLIEIKTTATSAGKAARIANAIADAYIAEQLEAKVRDTAEATRRIESRLESQRERVAAAERRIANFKAENSIFDSEGQLLSEKQLARLMEQTVLARNATAEAKAKHDQLQVTLRRKDATSANSEVLASHSVRMLKEQLVRATKREAELATRYGPLHPELIKARAEVANVRGQVMAEITQVQANVENDFRIARDRERQLAVSLEEIKQRQVRERDAVVTLRDLEREAMTSRQVFEAFLARYKQTTETQGLELADSRVIQPASVPINGAGPRRAIIAVAGLGGGLVLALGGVLLVELTRGGMRRPEDIERDLAIEHLASVPSLGLDESTGGDPLQDLRMLLAAPESPFAEAIRGLGHELVSRAGTQASMIVQIASPLPDPSRPAIAANLALLFALGGHRTLLIDADMRRPAISTGLGLAGRPGLADAIAGRTALEPLILRDATSGLNVLPATGGAPGAPQPAELLARGRTRELLAVLRRRYDVIIIDTPPLLPVVDGRIVATHADHVLLVTHSRHTSKELARRAIRSLGASAGRIMGAVIAGVDQEELSGDARILPLDAARSSHRRVA